MAGLPLIVTILFVDFIFTGSIPVLIQERIIAPGRQKIKIIKIRTMVDTPKSTNVRKNNSILKNEEFANYVPVFCKWLRKSGLDEILQVINVLKGEMSLVGPRPLLLREFELIKKENPALYKRREKLNSLPGITGYWQIYGERERGVKNLVELDEYYERNKCPQLDIKIILKTFIVMILAAHSDAIIGRKEKMKKLKISLAD